MTIYKEKYGFVYIWFDRKYKRYYVGSHWGFEDDGYICSSRMMRQSYNRRPDDFKRRIIKRIYTNRKDLLIEEERWLGMIDPDKTTPRNTTVESRKNVRYYNIKLGTQNHWWSDEDRTLTIGEKISISKTGKNTGPRDPSVGENISKSKKEKFAKKQEELGYKFSPEHCEKLADGRKGKSHTEEWKAENSIRMKKQWDDGTRKRAQPKKKMTKEEQAVVSSESLKSKWADPEWKERQRVALSEGAKSRPPRSEESKQKARLAQLGKTKNAKTYKIVYMDNTELVITGLKKYCKDSSVPLSSLCGALRTKCSLPKYNIHSVSKM
jgi:hypothetical protein